MPVQGGRIELGEYKHPPDAVVEAIGNGNIH
jgi:hypothetical protein